MATATMTQTENQLATVFQYTIDAYKIFQKLSELLPNPMSANIFTNFAEDERENRNLLEIKYLDEGLARMQIPLGGDLRIQDALEGNLSHRELVETLIARERTMEHQLAEWGRTGVEADRNLFNYIAASKRAHLSYLEREFSFLSIYDDWFKREDAEFLIIHGKGQ
jgi:hypothetical protein